MLIDRWRPQSVPQSQAESCRSRHCPDPVTMFPVTVALCCLLLHATVLATSDVEDKCHEKWTSLTYNIVSEYNETGRWLARVTGQRVAATPGPELGLWAIDVGHEVHDCEDAPSVKIAANIRMDSGVLFDVGLATDEQDEDEKVPPSFSEYEVIGDSSYKIFLKLRKWDIAESLCREDDANLLVINSADEAKAITGILERYPIISEDPYENKQIWVGLHDKNSEGQFTSVYNETLSEVGYDNWAAGEPNDLGSGEDCVSVLRNGRLNDEICAKKLAFICEKNVT